MIRKGFDSLGISFALKKNLWYLDAFEVQKRIVTADQPVIFDVGASEGSVTLKYLELYPSAIIHAFEPQPESFQQLNNRFSNSGNIYCHNMALAEKSELKKFYKTNEEASSSLLPSVQSGSFVDRHTIIAETYEVRSATLDDYCLDKGIEYIDILKMDVQGAELQVLKGGEKLLKENRINLIYAEVWFTEAYAGQPFYEDIALFLRNFGYRSFGLYNMHWDTKLNGKNLWADAIFINSKNVDR